MIVFAALLFWGVELSSFGADKSELAISRSASATKANCLPGAIGVNPVLPEFKDDNMSTPVFIQAMTPLAVQIQSKVGFPASVMIAQMIWETNQGTSRLAKENNNFGGISCDVDEKAPARSEAPWSTETLSDKIWNGVDYKFQHRCSSFKRIRKIVADGSEKALDEGGSYLEFKHPFDSVLYGVNTMMKSKAYNDPTSVHISGKPLGVKMREWGVTVGMNESARRFRVTKSNVEREKIRDNILRILQGVYAPRTKDCKTCPKSNDKYESSLRAIIKEYKLDLLDNFKAC